MLLFVHRFGYVFLQLPTKENLSADYNEKITLLSNQAKTIGHNADNVKITVKNIQDNRCPAGVQCVWEGYVDVEFELSNPQKEKTAFALCLGTCENINKGSKLNVVLGVKTYEIILFRVGEGTNKEVVFSVERI